MRTENSSTNHMVTHYWKDSQSHWNKKESAAVLGKNALTIAENIQQYWLLRTGRFPSTKWFIVVWGNREAITNKYMGIHIFFVLHIHTIPLPDLSCAAASKVRACSEEGEQQRHICLSMPVPSTLCPFPQKGGAIPLRPCRAWGRCSSSSLHQWVTGQRPSWHTGLPKIHTDRRGNQYPSKQSILYCSSAIYTGAQLQQQCAGGAVHPSQPQK